MQNTNIMEGMFHSLLPTIETWLRQVVSDEVHRALDAERKKAQPSKQYTREEVCKMLHITLPTLWKKTKDGEINAIKVGRRVLYQENEVKRLMQLR